MQIIHGAYTSAHIFTVHNPACAIEDYALAQIQMLCDNDAFQGSRIRIMPDVHPGIGGPIGLTATLSARILPGLVGVDIGCGITLARLAQTKIEYQKLDALIRRQIPSGFQLRNAPHRFNDRFDLAKLRCFRHIREDKAVLSLGTLGGGNHFIEADRDDEGVLYIAIHTGSRHLGKEVAEYYMKAGQRLLKKSGLRVPYELTWLEGGLADDYLHDLRLVQQFAALNREAVLDDLCRGMKWKCQESRSCVHNYVETFPDVSDGSTGSSLILRKGAISAQKNEPVIIPVNMRDGVILGTGLGNPDWNCSAPHGSGRIYKRSEVKNHFTVSNFKAEMRGIYSSCIGTDTLDEAPFAYRGLEELAAAIAQTVNVQKIIRPVYNYKAGKDM